MIRALTLLEWACVSTLNLWLWANAYRYGFGCATRSAPGVRMRSGPSVKTSLDGLFTWVWLQPGIMGFTFGKFQQLNCSNLNMERLNQILTIWVHQKKKKMMLSIWVGSAEMISVMWACRHNSIHYYKSHPWSVIIKSIRSGGFLQALHALF